jgi:hypothetical protein
LVGYRYRKATADQHMDRTYLRTYIKITKEEEIKKDKLRMELFEVVAEKGLRFE